MQTYTHAVVGAAISSLLFPDDPVATIFLVAGSTTPDLVLVPKFVIDKIAGRLPFSGELGWQTKFLLAPSHSLVLWALFAWLVRAHLFLFIFAVGGLSHVLIDLCSHGDPEINKRDPLYFWPITNKKVHLGTWEYRITAGHLWPIKLFEAFVIAISVLVIFFKWRGGL